MTFIEELYATEAETLPEHIEGVDPHGSGTLIAMPSICKPRTSVAVHLAVTKKYVLSHRAVQLTNGVSSAMLTLLSDAAKKQVQRIWAREWT